MIEITYVSFTRADRILWVGLEHLDDESREWLVEHGNTDLAPVIWDAGVESCSEYPERIQIQAAAARKVEAAYVVFATRLPPPWRLANN